jgi:hypothetical protein
VDLLRRQMATPDAAIARRVAPLRILPHIKVLGWNNSLT